MNSQLMNEGGNTAAVTAENVTISGNIYVKLQDKLDIEEFDVPRLRNRFKGREKEIEELDSLFFVQKRKKVVVCGFPGYGKSELAKQYAQRCVENNNIHRAFWVNCADYDYIRNFSKKLKNIFKAFKGELCLFIFDNAICRRKTYEYEPPDDDSFILLITSIETDWGDDVVPLKLEPLPPESAVDVYQSILNDNYQEEDHKLYEQLSDDVGNVPLGLQVGGTITILGDICISSPPKDQLEIEEFDVPRLINTFKGREKEIEELDSLFFEQRRKKVVVCGFPGFGKSELAKQYVYHCVENNYIHRAFWVSCAYFENIRKFFKKLKKIYVTFKGKRCLFIFDNAISRREIYEYEPPGDDSFILLITGLATGWAHDVVPLKLGPLSPASAVDVYQSILNNNYQEKDRMLYEQLADIIGNVPLGLQVIGAYVRQQMKALGSKFNFELYIESLKGREDQFFDAPIPSCSSNSYKNSMYGAFKICLEKIETHSNFKERELARKILYLYSCLQPEFFNFDDVVNIFIFIETITKDREDIELFKYALGLLDNYNFVNFDRNKKTLHMNRYIQDLLRYHFVHKCM